MNKITVDPLTPIYFNKPLKMQKDANIKCIMELDGGELLFIDDLYDVEELIRWYKYTRGD